MIKSETEVGLEETGDNVAKQESPQALEHLEEVKALYELNKQKGLTLAEADTLVRVLQEHIIFREVPYILEQFGGDQTPEEIWQNLVSDSGEQTMFKMHRFEDYEWPEGYWARKLAENNLGRSG